MTKLQPTRAEFCQFLGRVTEGKVSPADWNQHAVTRYDELEVEAARKELVRAAILGGQCSANPVQGDLGVIAERLLSELN
jgi:hypothetical protein